MTDDRMALLSPPIKTHFKLNIPSLGVLYGFWATVTFRLHLPERYSNLLRVDGGYKTTLCSVWAGGRYHKITLAKLSRRSGWFRKSEGLRLWAWRAATLKTARQVILAALEKEKQEWDKERYSETSGDTGRSIL